LRATPAHVPIINLAIETAVHGIIFRAALGFLRQSASGLAKLLDGVINRLMRN